MINSTNVKKTSNELSKIKLNDNDKNKYQLSLQLHNTKLPVTSNDNEDNYNDNEINNDKYIEKYCFENDSKLQSNVDITSDDEDDDYNNSSNEDEDLSFEFRHYVNQSSSHGKINNI